MHVHFLGCVQLFVTSRTVALQAPLSMEFFRQEHWSGLPLPTPGTLLEFSLIFLLKEYMRPTANFLHSNTVNQSQPSKTGDPSSLGS